MIFIVYCYPDPSSCTVGKGVALTFLVIIRRLKWTELGFNVAVDGNGLLIGAIEEKSFLSEASQRHLRTNNNIFHKQESTLDSRARR